MGGGVKDFEPEPEDHVFRRHQEELEAAREAERLARERELEAQRRQAQLEAAQREAEARAAEAQRRAAEAQQKAEEERRRAEMRAEEQRIQAEQAQRRAEEQLAESQRQAQAQAQAADESQRKLEEARRKAEAQAAEAQRLADAATRKAEEEAARAEAAARQAREDRESHEAAARAAAEEREKLQSLVQNLSAGIEPEYYPTEEEVAEAEKRIQYRKENLHFAVAGTTGTGKSSLINAFRRLRDYDVKKGAARTGTSETTKGIGRYPDPDPELPRRRFIWYDLPGAGSQDIDDWEYFKKQQLFVFDLVIVVISGRFRKCDAILLQHCTRLDVPTFLVRSKSDQEIAAIHKQMEQEDNPDSSDDEDSDDDSPVTIHSEPPKNYYREARKKYISEARQNSREELAKAGIPDQHLYLVTNEGIHLVSKYLGKKDISSLRKATKATYERLIDEEALVRDLLHAAYKRRYSSRLQAVPQPAPAASSSR